MKKDSQIDINKNYKPYANKTERLNKKENNFYIL